MPDFQSRKNKAIFRVKCRIQDRFLNLKQYSDFYFFQKLLSVNSLMSFYNSVLWIYYSTQRNIFLTFNARKTQIAL